MAQINRPTDYFNTKLYTGNGTTGHNITGVGFQPDWLWIKERSSTSAAFIYDIIRGVDIKITPSTTDGDATNLDSMSSFDSDGFTVGVNNAVNENTQTYASWNWLASNTTASNTDGSITSTVSANTTSGFSIVSYTGNGSAGATVGHGLGTIPAMVIQKRRSGSTASWVTWHQSIHSTSGNTGAVFLNLTNANSTGNSDTIAGVSSTLITTAGTGAVNPSGDTCIMYCFAEKKGFSKFGSYTGNGNADGTFVYTGFKPAWVMIKRTDAIQQWGIMDNKRNTFNPMNAPLFAESTQAESSSAFNNFDILSNGIKMKTGDQWTNASGGTYIYMAFAESPLVGTNNTPATAR